MPKKTYNEKKLLAQLRALSKRLGKTPTLREFGKDPRCASSSTLLAYFGSITEAQKKAGLETSPPAGCKTKHTKEQMLEALMTACARHGKVPSFAAYKDDNENKIPADTIRRYFGTWNNALSCAGLETRKPKSQSQKYTDQFLLAQITSCGKRLGKTPTAKAFDEDAKTKVGSRTIIHRFGTWNTALSRAGFSPKHKRAQERA